MGSPREPQEGPQGGSHSATRGISLTGRMLVALQGAGRDLLGTSRARIGSAGVLGRSRGWGEEGLEKEAHQCPMGKAPHACVGGLAAPPSH